MKALFFLAALAIVGLVVTGAIKLQKTDGTINIQIDKQRAAQDAERVLEEGRELFDRAEARLNDESNQR